MFSVSLEASRLFYPPPTINSSTVQTQAAKPSGFLHMVDIAVACPATHKVSIAST